MSILTKECSSMGFISAFPHKQQVGANLKIRKYWQLLNNMNKLWRKKVFFFFLKLCLVLKAGKWLSKHTNPFLHNSFSILLKQTNLCFILGSFSFPYKGNYKSWFGFVFVWLWYLRYIFCNCIAVFRRFFHVRLLGETACCRYTECFVFFGLFAEKLFTGREMILLLYAIPKHATETRDRQY